eukprot:1522104-Ditylum_brightwellii.AAC.1
MHQMKGLGQYLVQQHGVGVKTYFDIEEVHKIDNSKIDNNTGEEHPDWIVDLLPSDFQRPNNNEPLVVRPDASANPPVTPIALAPPPYCPTGDTDSLDTWGSSIYRAVTETRATAL